MCEQITDDHPIADHKTQIEGLKKEKSIKKINEINLKDKIFLSNKGWME